MANRNGMGPMNEGPLTGRGLGTCSKGNNLGKIGLGIGTGLGMAWGYRNRSGRGRGVRRMGRGLGIHGFRQRPGNWQASPVDDKEALARYKEQLQQELAEVEKQMTHNEDQ